MKYLNSVVNQTAVTALLVMSLLQCCWERKLLFYKKDRHFTAHL